jgi:hypothetical protein
MFQKESCSTSAPSPLADCLAEKCCAMHVRQQCNSCPVKISLPQTVGMGRCEGLNELHIIGMLTKIAFHPSNAG